MLPRNGRRFYAEPWPCGEFASSNSGIYTVFRRPEETASSFPGRSPDTFEFCAVVRYLCRPSAYLVAVVRLGLSQYGLLHLGQIVGVVLRMRGTQECPQRSHFHPLSLVIAIVGKCAIGRAPRDS